MGQSVTKPDGSKPPITKYTDRPWIYTFDGDSMTIGGNYQNVQVPILQDSDFFLRRVAGVPNLASTTPGNQGTFVLKRYAVQLFQNPIVMPYDWAVVPEVQFNAASAIAFDINNVSPANNAGRYYSQIAFQGIRRFYDIYTYPNLNPYILKSFAYALGPVSVAAPSSAPYTTATLQLLDFDFELHAIKIDIQTSPGTYVTSDHQAKIVLYDFSGYPTASAPVVDSYLSIDSQYNSSCFPVPLLVYPIGSQLRVDIYPLINGATTFMFTFLGQWRMPA